MMDSEWLQVGHIALHVPTIAYVEEIEPNSPTAGPRLRVGFMGGAYRELEGAEARELLAWTGSRSRELAAIAAD